MTLLISTRTALTERMWILHAKPIVTNSDSVNPVRRSLKTAGAKASVTPTNTCSPMKLIDQVNAGEGCPLRGFAPAHPPQVVKCWRQIIGKFGFQVEADTASPFFSPTNVCRKSLLVKPFLQVVCHFQNYGRSIPGCIFTAMITVFADIFPLFHIISEALGFPLSCS